MERVEYRDICSKCGGKCCKKSGCDYSTKDFTDLKYETLYNKLLEGNISIVSMLNFKIINGRMTCFPFLYLRARNEGREVVDLLSLKKRCSMLKKDGCSYSVEDRPSGGINLIPKTNGPCRPEIDPFEIVKEWDMYQRPLGRLIKRITGMSVDKRLRNDVVNLFVDVLNKNYEGVSPIELEDVSEMLPILYQAFPEEYEKAKEKVHNQPKLFVKSF